MSWPLRIAALSKGGSFYNGWGLAFDFVNGLYRVGVGNAGRTNWLGEAGVSYARTGEQLSYNPVTGQWEIFAANVPAILAGAGQDIAEGTTNKCANYNAAPTNTTGVSKFGDAASTLTRVDMTATLRAAGFGQLIDAGKLNGFVFKLDNSAGSTVAGANIGGVVGNTNTHTVSAVGWMTAGSGAYISFDGASGVQTFPASTPTRISRGGTPSSSSTNGYVIAPAGSVVYFILNQLEEKPYATNPVIVAGASASRGTATPVVTGLASLLTPPFTLVAVANMSAIDGVGRTLACLSDGTSSNRIDLRRTTANTMQLVQIGGTLPSIPSFANKAGPRLLKSAVRVRTDGSYAFAVDGAALATGTGGTPPPGLAQLNTGNLVGPSTYLNSPLLFVGIAPDLTDAQLQALTASNGLLTDFL